MRGVEAPLLLYSRYAYSSLIPCTGLDETDETAVTEINKKEMTATNKPQSRLVNTVTEMWYLKIMPSTASDIR